MRLHAAGVVLVLLIVASSRADAQILQPVSNGRATLRGVSWLSRVVVMGLNAETEGDGLTPSAIQTDVELRLRQNRIPIEWPTDLSAFTSETHSAFLRVMIRASKRDGLYAYHVDVSVMQNARLTGKVGVTSPLAEGASLVVPTWTSSTIGTVGAANLRSLREAIQDHIDELANDWLAVH